MRFRFPLPFVAILFAVISIGPSAKAGMSVDLDQLEGVIKSNPKFDALFIDNLEFGSTGEAMRLGRHFGAVSASPVGPYQFPARFAGESGEGFPLVAILHTRMLFENAAGEAINEDAAAKGEATSVRERLIRVELLDTESLTGEEVSRALDKLFGGGNETKDSAEPAKPVEMPANANSGSDAPGGPIGAGSFRNQLVEGDRKYAGEYHCDDYTVSVGAGQTLKVDFLPEGFIPVIMSKKDGRYSNSAGRADGETIGERVSFTYTSPSDAEVIVSLTTRDKGESGPYEAKFTVDGVTRTPAANSDGSGYVPVE